MNNAYLSFDVETDGPVPMKNSLLSIGMCLVDESGVSIDSLTINIHKRPDAVEDPKTMTWWKTQQTAWDACHTDLRTPEEAMIEVAQFYSKHTTRYLIRWVAGPACFDWMWLKNYYEMYGPDRKPDIGFNCACLSELKRVLWNSKILTTSGYKNLHDSSTQGCVKDSHLAVNDAKYQGMLYCGITNFLKRNNFSVN